MSFAVMQAVNNGLDVGSALAFCKRQYWWPKLDAEGKPVFDEDSGEVVLVSDGRTKQDFKDQADPNKIVKKYGIRNMRSHFEAYGGEYADFSDIGDLMESYARLEKARDIFAKLPAEVRREMGQNPQEFFEFVNDPANKDRLPELLPELAKAGDYAPRVSRNAANMASLDRLNESIEALATTLAPGDESPPGGSDGDQEESS
mgnify:CR=1 FL=1